MDVFNSNYKQNLMKKKFWDEYEKKYISLFEYKMQYENEKLDILYDNIYYSKDCVIWHDDEKNDIDDYNKTDNQWFEETEKIEQDLKKDYLEQLEEEQEYDDIVYGKY
jgi:hypothetical protein